MLAPSTEELKQKIKETRRGFLSAMRRIRQEGRTDVEQTIVAIDQKRAEAIRGRIQSSS